ncbi:MAG: restriction endonuclease subunit S [candidate division WOR-3 bacterium]
MAFNEAVTVNPPVALRRGDTYGFVDMDSVSPGARYVGAVEQRIFEGGGARFMHGDTLMARITPCLENGKIARFRGTTSDEVAFGSTEFIVIRGRPGITDNDFAYYLTRWDYVRGYAISQMTGSSGRLRVPTSALSQLNVAIPPLPVQRRIARILGALDDKIELNRKMNETLEQMCRAIFKSWFVDFEPVRDKGMVDSELGMIPKGWEVKALGDVATVIKGRSYSSDELQPSKVALVTLKSFNRGGGYRADGLKSFTGEFKPEHAIRPGEVVISFTDVTQAAEVIGRPAIVRASSDYDTLVASLDVGIIRPNQTFLSAPFFYCLLSAQDFTDYILGYVNGTTVLHLDKQGILSYRFAYPPTSVAQAFADIAVPAFARIDANESESRTLAAIRDALLPKLMSGEIEVM